MVNSFILSLWVYSNFPRTFDIALLDLYYLVTLFSKELITGMEHFWSILFGYIHLHLSSLSSHLYMVHPLTILFFFYLILYVPSTIFQLYRDRSSWVEPVLSYDKFVLLKDHNAVTPVRLEPAAPRSRVKHFTTEPLRSQTILFESLLHVQYTFMVHSLF